MQLVEIPQLQQQPRQQFLMSFYDINGVAHATQAAADAANIAINASGGSVYQEYADSMAEAGVLSLGGKQIRQMSQMFLVTLLFCNPQVVGCMLVQISMVLLVIMVTVDTQLSVV